MGALSMKPLDPDLESLLREWVEKAEADLEAAEELAPRVASSAPLRETRNSFLHFHHRRFERLVVQVLYPMFGRAAPNKIPRFVLLHLGLPPRCSLADIL